MVALLSCSHSLSRQRGNIIRARLGERRAPRLREEWWGGERLAGAACAVASVWSLFGGEGCWYVYPAPVVQSVRVRSETERDVPTASRRGTPSLGGRVRIGRKGRGSAAGPDGVGLCRGMGMRTRMRRRRWGLGRRCYGLERRWFPHGRRWGGYVRVMREARGVSCGGWWVGRVGGREGVRGARVQVSAGRALRRSGRCVRDCRLGERRCAWGAGVNCVRVCGGGGVRMFLGGTVPIHLRSAPVHTPLITLPVPVSLQRTLESLILRTRPRCISILRQPRYPRQTRVSRCTRESCTKDSAISRINRIYVEVREGQTGGGCFNVRGTRAATGNGGQEGLIVHECGVCVSVCGAVCVCDGISGVSGVSGGQCDARYTHVRVSASEPYSASSSLNEPGSVYLRPGPAVPSISLCDSRVPVCFSSCCSFLFEGDQGRSGRQV